jgi:hypothetical protein
MFSNYFFIKSERTNQARKMVGQILGEKIIIVTPLGKIPTQMPSTSAAPGHGGAGLRGLCPPEIY